VPAILRAAARSGASVGCVTQPRRQVVDEPDLAEERLLELRERRLDEHDPNRPRMLSIEACTRCCSSRSVSTCLGSAPDQRSLLDHRIALGQEFVPRRLRLGGHLLGRGACLGKDRRGSISWCVSVSLYPRNERGSLRWQIFGVSGNSPLWTSW
jgi:hypothetical protein